MARRKKPKRRSKPYYDDVRCDGCGYVDRFEAVTDSWIDEEGTVGVKTCPHCGSETGTFVSLPPVLTFRREIE